MSKKKLKIENLQAETSNFHNAIKEELSQKRVSMSTIKERLNAKKSEIDRLNEEIKKILIQKKGIKMRLSKTLKELVKLK